MRRLRAECPWKRAQTHRSLVRYLVEELHETVDAIESGTPADLREELGDLLLQVYFHAAVAEEAGEFTLDDVAAGVVEKMVRRNPHVFGEAGERGSAAEVNRAVGVGQGGREAARRRHRRPRAHPPHAAVRRQGARPPRPGRITRDDRAGRPPRAQPAARAVLVGAGRLVVARARARGRGGRRRRGRRPPRRAAPSCSCPHSGAGLHAPRIVASPDVEVRATIHVDAALPPVSGGDVPVAPSSLLDAIARWPTPTASCRAGRGGGATPTSTGSSPTRPPARRWRPSSPGPARPPPPHRRRPAGLDGRAGGVRRPGGDLRRRARARPRPGLAGRGPRRRPPAPARRPAGRRCRRARTARPPRAAPHDRRRPPPRRRRRRPRRRTRPRPGPARRRPPPPRLTTTLTRRVYAPGQRDSGVSGGRGPCGRPAPGRWWRPSRGSRRSRRTPRGSGGRRASGAASGGPRRSRRGRCGPPGRWSVTRTEPVLNAGATRTVIVTGLPVRTVRALTRSDVVVRTEAAKTRLSRAEAEQLGLAGGVVEPVVVGDGEDLAAGADAGGPRASPASSRSRRAAPAGRRPRGAWSPG
jgi:NTP pyrophosphatase (non-canonical NTP hydrolase)